MGYRQEKNKYGYLNLPGLFSLIKESLFKEAKALKKKGLNASVKEAVFCRVVTCYIKHVMEDALNSLIGVKWYPRFGRIQVAKIYCTKFAPKRAEIIDGKKIYKNVRTFQDSGYFYYFRWNAPRKYIWKWELKVGDAWKEKLLHKLTVEKVDYLDS